ncbi:hypothetical protein [Pulveribacter sp.]|uniref:hypothetical protein n=1 Tax=Pulveribacter sp. TaxID=2678893 RepID=UPI0028A05AA0|nr:hypothetical protein [Pulveribacter sp.]
MHFAPLPLHRALLCALLSLTAAGMAQAAPASGAPPKKSKAVKVKPQQNNSQETAAERDRRLYRECKGLPNAGACLGYTRR